jgi:hypothetical protein
VRRTGGVGVRREGGPLGQQTATGSARPMVLGLNFEREGDRSVVALCTPSNPGPPLAGEGGFWHKRARMRRPSPGHKLPDSDAERRRSRCHRSPSAGSASALYPRAPRRRRLWVIKRATRGS